VKVWRKVRRNNKSFLDLCLLTLIVLVVWKLTIDAYLHLADTGVQFCREGAIGRGKIGVSDVQRLE